MTSKAIHNQINEGYESLVTQDAAGLNSVSVVVGGVHCALCIQKIESNLIADENVQKARLNFSTGRLHIEWIGSADNANRYVKNIEALGYRVNPYSPDVEKNNSEKENRFLLLCLGVAGFAMGNIMLLSVGLWSADGETMGQETRNLLHWMSALIAIPVIIFSGRPFFRSAWQVLKKSQTNMDVPISLALILASGMSLLETVNHGEHVYFDSAIMLMFFLLIGRYLDFRARRNARSAATDLMQTLSGFATVIEGRKTKRVLIRDIREGMCVVVSVGEKIPVDGTVIEGHSTIDTSLITGETLPRDVQVGEGVYAGTLNQSAPLTIKVSKAADNSLLSDIIRLMEKAEQGQAKYVRLADRAARYYTPIVHILAGLAFILWVSLGGVGWQEALLISITVLIITCPCALGLAVPVVQVLATSFLMKKRILVKSGDALERLAVIDTIFFDKTGTLTTGKPDVIGEYDPHHIKIAASLASYSQHPLSQALVKSYVGEILLLEDIKEHAGQGMSASLDGQSVRMGKRSWCGAVGKNQSNDIELCLSVDDVVLTYFIFEDRIKDNVEDIISKFKKKNIDMVLLSGDRQEVVKSVAQSIGIEKTYADLTPLEKDKILKQYKNLHKKILMVGDGLNDAPVLAGADISMAPGTAVDMAQNAADIVFMGDDLKPVYQAYRIACGAQNLVKQNFMLAILYNCIAVPLAFAGMVTPMLAALAMSGSSLVVIANSYRLKWVS